MVNRKSGARGPDAAGHRERGPRGPSVTSQVVEAVFQMLRSGEFRPGSRLPSEWQLVEQLGVGRSAIREGIRELAALGVVDVQPGRGTFVRSIRPDLILRMGVIGSEADRAMVREFLEVRLILEPESAALAAVRASEVDLERLAHDVERLAEAVNVGYRPPEDLGFHLDIVRSTHNSALTRLAGAIVSFYQRDEALPTERDVQDHRAILDAIGAGDPNAARSAMHLHLQGEISLRHLRSGTAATRE